MQFRSIAEMHKPRFNHFKMSSWRGHIDTTRFDADAFVCVGNGQG